MANRVTAASTSRGGGKAADGRDRLYRAVIAASKRLGIDDGERRDLQREVTGKASMTEMSIADLGRLLDRLNRDWTGPMAHRAHLGKIRALWWALYWLGEVDRTDEGAISAFVKRQTGVAAVRFLDHRKAPAVIEALKAWAGRAGVAWPGADVANADCEGGGARLDRIAVLTAIAHRLAQAAEIDGHPIAWCADAMGLQHDARHWTHHELDAAIRHAGLALRKLKG